MGCQFEGEIRRADPSSAICAWDPQNVVSAVVVGDAAEDKEQVAEAVEIPDRFGVHAAGVGGHERDAEAFGAADDGACDVERGGEGGAAGEDEAGERRQAFVEFVDGVLKAFDLAGDDAECAAGLFVGFEGRCEVGAKIEHVVHDQGEDAGEGGVGGVGGDVAVCCGLADGGVGLVDGAVGLDAKVVFLDAGAGGEAGGAVVAGAGVDLVQFDHVITLVGGFVRSIQRLPGRLEMD